MRKLILVFAFLGLLSIPSIAQNTTLGGISCGWNLTPTVTICEGTTINASAWVSSLGSYNFSWGTSPAKYTLVDFVSSTVNNSTAKIQFTKPGIYQVYLLVSTYSPQALKSAYIIVLSRGRKVTTIID